VPELVLHGRTVETVFDLLGRDENDMTFALGWGLRQSPALLRSFLNRVSPGTSVDEPLLIELQEHGAEDRGFTDIEVLSAEVHLVLEAKRGWTPPNESQLRRYEGRLAASGRPAQVIVILTQNGGEQVVRHRLGPWAPPEPIRAIVMGWADVVTLAQQASRAGRMADRRVAAELATYLRGVADMRDTSSNEVYVVSLTAQPWPGWPADLTPIDIVVRHGLYFFPATGTSGWHKMPPNYIAFRY
jgi:hypothetical protein